MANKKPKIDFTTFSPKGPVASPEATVHTTRWWTLKDETEMAQAIEGVVEHIQDHTASLENQRQISARLYSNTSVIAPNGLSVTRSSTQPSTKAARVSYNLVQSVIDTVTSKLSKNKPKPLFLTSGADWSMQRRAKNLGRFVEGVFYENNAYDMGQDALRDAGVYGDGVIHVFASNGRIKFERVLPSELYVDEIDGFYGDPRQMHRAKNVDREVLVEMFPKHKKDIEALSAAVTPNGSSYESVSDVVTVIESWRLPSGKDAGDGLHTIKAGSFILFKEEWTRERFPFAFMPWAKRLYGFWNQGAAERLQNIQLEINKLLWVIQRSMHLAGTFKLALENSSKIVKEHANNDFGAIITYTNTPPQYLLPPVVQPEVYSHLQTLKNAGYEQEGVSQLSASAQKPMGLDSGKALREYNDIESDRFVVLEHAYEDFFLKLSDLVIDEAKHIEETTEEGLSVKAPGRHSADAINWSDVNMERDELIMKVYPISSLPEDPSGRLQTIQEYAQAGFISPTAARRLLDFPDLEAEEKLANAPEDRVHKIMEDIVDGSGYTPPDAFMDPAAARVLALKYYNYGCCTSLDESKLDKIRTFLSQLDAIDAQAMQPALPPAMPDAGAPPADPTQTPQSDLLPNTNSPQGV